MKQIMSNAINNIKTMQGREVESSPGRGSVLIRGHAAHNITKANTWRSTEHRETQLLKINT